MNATKRKQELYRVGACVALGNNAHGFIERNPHSRLGMAFRRYARGLKKGFAAEPQTPGERHAYERGIKQGQRERVRIACCPVEITNIRRGVLSDGTTAGIVYGEINPDVYALFLDGGDRALMNEVTAFFNMRKTPEDGDVVLVRWNYHHLLCKIHYGENSTTLVNICNGKAFATVTAQDRFTVIGKLEHFGRDLVYPNTKYPPLSDETRKRGYITAADIVRGNAATA